MINVKSLYKSFGQVIAVNDCTFQVNKGKITSLLGPNGSGKTTVFNVLSGYYPDYKGSVFLDGRDIKGLKVHTLAKNDISRIFQMTRLFDNLDVNQNLLLAIEKQDHHLIKNIFGLNERPSHKGMNRLLSMFEIDREAKASELSYGQKRLVELARAIIKPHKILLLDEPVAGVNQKLRKKISEILLNLKEEGETIFLIEHDIDFALSLSDNSIVLDKGKVIAQGNPSDLRKNDELINAYLGK